MAVALLATSLAPKLFAEGFAEASTATAADAAFPVLFPGIYTPAAAPVLPAPDIGAASPEEIFSYGNNDGIPSAEIEAPGAAPVSADNFPVLTPSNFPQVNAGTPAAGAPGRSFAFPGAGYPVAGYQSASYQSGAAAPASSSTGTSTGGAAAASSDTAAPQIFNVRPPDGAFTGSSVTFSADYTDPEPSSGIDPETAMVHVDNRMLYDGCAASETHISCPKSGLSEGKHKLEIFVCDQAQNCSQTLGAFYVDTTAPAITGMKPSGTINTATAAIKAAFDDGDGAGIDPASARVSMDTKDITPACSVTATGASCNVSELEEGDHDVVVQADDKLGNRASKAWSFKVDFSAVGIMDQLPAAGSWQKAGKPLIGASFKQASREASIKPDSIRMYVDNTEVTSRSGRGEDRVTYTPARALADGRHDVRVTVSDDAGHGGQSEWSFFVDTLPPEITGQSPTVSTTATPMITARYSDNGSGIRPASVRIWVDGVDKTAGAEIAEERARYTPKPPEMPLLAGVHTAQISVTDVAGNRKTTVWNFTVAGPPAASRPLLPATPAVSLIAIPEYRESYTVTPAASGSWRITGLMAWPTTYILPWYNPKPTGGTYKSEILIVNRGAGEAFVSIFMGGQEKWRGNIPEGGKEALELPETVGGPLKAVCPTGQELEVTHLVSGPGFESETVAVPKEELEPVSVLPWFDPSPAGGAGSGRLVIANTGEAEAEVDIYQGDPESSDSLKGHYSIKPDSAAVTKLPDAGGPVKVVSTNNQPIMVSQRVLFKDSFREIVAPGLSRLATSYLLPQEKDPPSEEEVTSSRILVGNPSAKDAMVEIRSGERLISDPENPGSNHFTIPASGARSIDLTEMPEEPLEITCLNCSLFDGLAVGREIVRNNSLSYVMGTPQPPAWPGDNAA